MKILALVPDAFGGHGGIAQFNRDLLTALCAYPACTEVVAIPRLMPNPPEPMPEKLNVTEGINSKLKYIISALRTTKGNQGSDLIVCGHINLLLVAYFLRLCSKVPVLLEIYGIDAWMPSKSRLSNFLAGRIDAFVWISELTRDRFLQWATSNQCRGYILPNAIHTERHAPGPKHPELLKRYGLEGKTVLMTLGRLVSRQRNKGFDEILELLPELAQEVPNIVYLVVGDGADRRRLEEKADALGVADRPVFTGFIPETEKADHTARQMRT